MRALVSSGRSDFDSSARRNSESPAGRGRRHRLDRGRTARRRPRRKGRPAHRDDLDRIPGLHRLERVAGIDRPHEGIGRDDRADVRNLHHVEEGRDPRHQILARGRRRRQEMRIFRGELDQQRRHILGEPVIIGRVVGEQHLSDPGDLRRRLGHGTAIRAGHQHIDLRAGDLLGGGDRVQGRGLQHPIVVFGDDKSRHQITRASVLSMFTSSSTEPTLRPPWRFAGSSTLRTTRCGVTSMPSASGVVVAIGFFLALMMFGNEA